MPIYTNSNDYSSGYGILLPTRFVGLNTIFFHEVDKLIKNLCELFGSRFWFAGQPVELPGQ